MKEAKLELAGSALPTTSFGGLFVTRDVKQIAELLRVSTSTVGSWLQSGELVAFNVSRSASSRRPRWRITEASLQEFIARRQASPKLPRMRQSMKKFDDDFIRFYR